MTRTPDIDILIIGAGIAGAATARDLARRGASVAILERELLTGAHATGRNASLVLTNVTDATSLALAREGARFYADPPRDLPLPIPFNRSGSLLLASGPAGPERLERDTEWARSRGLNVERLSAAEARARVPILEEDQVAGAAFCPDDGVVDIDALLRSLLADAEAHGAQRIECRGVLGIRTDAGAVTGVETAAGPIDCRVVVNAAGPWAGPLGAEAGAPLPLRPTRRHIVVTSPMESVNPGWPFTWDIDRPFYFRPDSDGLLLCPCDVTDAEDMDETPRPEWIEKTLAEARRRLPRAGAIDAAFAWAGIRTLTPDGRFVIGFDHRVRNLFWAAGLGGHGITCGPALGRIAAELIVDGKADGVDTELLAPGRFR